MKGRSWIHYVMRKLIEASSLPAQGDSTTVQQQVLSSGATTVWHLPRKKLSAKCPVTKRHSFQRAIDDSGTGVCT